MALLPSSSMPYFLIISYLMLSTAPSLSRLDPGLPGLQPGEDGSFPIPFPFPSRHNVSRLSEMRQCWGSMDDDMAGCMVEANEFLGRGSDQSGHGSAGLSTTCCMAFNEMTDRCAKDGFAFDVFIPPLVKEYCGFNL